MVTEPSHSSTISTQTASRPSAWVSRRPLIGLAECAAWRAHPRTRVLSHAPCYLLSSNPYDRCLRDAGDHRRRDAVRSISSKGT
eukprot:445268-Prymnesium_polylepis.1